MRPSDRSKDQTYYLAGIPEKSLARTLFPIAHLSKSEVKAKAQEWGLPTAQRPESMGICFVGEKKRFDSFLGMLSVLILAPGIVLDHSIAQYLSPRPGRIIDQTTSKIIGKHDGIWTFTIGQNARIPGQPVRMFVSHKDPATNTIFVVPGP